MVVWGVWFIVICFLVMGNLVGGLTWIVHKRLFKKPNRDRSPTKVDVRLPAQEPSTLHKKSRTLEGDPLYRMIIQKLQALDHEIGTLPLRSARRRFLEGQQHVYAIVRTTAELAYRILTKPAPSNSSSNHR